MSTEQISLYLEIDEDTRKTLPQAVVDTLPSEQSISRWLASVLATIGHENAIELSIRIVSAAESNALNLQYRNKDKPTNVLSFPSDLPDFVESNNIGDIAICAELVCNEAHQQGKSPENHWAHLCMHGLLHLLGYDHITEEQAKEMEAIEVASLHKMSIQDPYHLI